MPVPTSNSNNPALIVFIGGGNMASAVLGGLLRQGWATERFLVIDPDASTRQRLTQTHGVRTLPAADESLRRADMLVWAVKPQSFAEAAAAVRPHVQDPLHLSVAAGIRCDSIGHWLNTTRVVRTMPNTPALIGQGMTALFAPGAVPDTDRQWAHEVLSPTGQLLWVDNEALLDAVTALSGSGPAYVFYVLEAMVRAGVEMGLSAQQSHQLAIGTFAGATALAQSSADGPAVLRERVTSKGGTTHAAISALEAAGVQNSIVQAIHAAQARAAEMAQAFAAGQ